MKNICQPSRCLLEKRLRKNILKKIAREEGHWLRKWWKDISEKSPNVPKESQLQTWSVICQDSGKMSLNNNDSATKGQGKQPVTQYCNNAFCTVESIMLPSDMIYRIGQDTLEKTGLRMWIMIFQRFFFFYILIQ